MHSPWGRLPRRSCAGATSLATGRALVVGCLATVAAAFEPQIRDAATASAATYYVDGSAPGCSNTGPGSDTTPYCTIGAALAARRGPGVVIEVAPAVYREQVTIPASGTAVSPFVVRAAGPGVVIDGADDFSSPGLWTNVAGDVWLAASVSWTPKQVLVDGARLAASSLAPASLPAGTFRYVSGTGLYVNVGGGSPGSHATFVGRRANGFRLSNRSWVTIEGFTVVRMEERGFYLSSYSNHCTIVNNVIEHAGLAGIHASSAIGLTLAYNHVSDCADHGINLSAVSSSSIGENRVCRSVLPGNKPASGIYLTSGSSGNMIERNQLFENRGSGIKINGSSVQNVCCQNLAWKNGEHGYEHSSAAGTRHVGDVAHVNGLSGFSFASNSKDGALHNSIAVDNGLGGRGFDLAVDGGSRTGFVSDHNILWNTTADPVVKFDKATHGTVVSYVAASGLDSSSIQADPLFVDAAAGVFDPMPGSPAIDAGTTEIPVWPATDMHGRARYDEPLTPNSGTGAVTFVDRGACEYVRPNMPPVALLAALPASGNAPLQVVADASASHDHNGTVVSYFFDFGDGNTLGPQPQATAAHHYGQGLWTLQVIVTDNHGEADTARTDVIVTGPNQAPEGRIDVPAAAVMIAAGQSVRFVGSVTDPDGPTPLRHRWDFGGGASPDSLLVPGPVVFDQPGRFVVTYTPIDGMGLPDPTPASCIVTVRAPIAGVAADGIHWTFTGPNAVALDWRGSDNTVRWGPTVAYGNVTVGTPPVPYPFSSGGPYWEAKLTGLLPDTEYHYAIGLGGADHTFRTPPLRGASGFSLYVQGDVGSSLNYGNVAPVQAQIAAGMPDFVLMVGDLTYANDKGQAAVDVHFNDMMAWSQDAAYMPAWGNHEWAAPDDLTNYKGRFALPNPQTSPGSPTVSCCGEDWYWFDYGNVRFLGYPEPWTGALAAWNTKAATLMQEAQNDTLIDFVVTFGHRPAYSSGHHAGEAPLRALLDALGDRFPKYVLNVNGHSHDYERSHPQHGVVHVTAGTGGSSLEAASGACKWAGGCPPPAWSAFRAMHYVAFRLDVTDDRLEGRAYCGPLGNAANNDLVCVQGTVIDSFVIGTGAPPAANQPPVAALTLRATPGAGLDVITADASGTTDADGDSLLYRFDFGDGTITAPSRASIVTHAYAPGQWTARVMVSDSRGGADTASATVTVEGNLVRNPSFETATTGWNANGSGTTYARVPGGRLDAFCAELRGAATLSSFGLNDSPNWVAATVAGQRYRFAAWVRSAAHRGSVTLKVREYLAGVQQGATYNSAAVVLTPAWQAVTLEVVASASGSTLDLQILDRPIANGEVFQVDDVSALVVLPAPPPVNQPPVAALTAPAFGVAPFSCALDASGSTDPEGGALTFTFDFGDGATLGPQGAATAVHVYAAGNRTARVIVTDAQGAADTASVDVTAALNLVRNPSFETTLTGWNANGAGTPTVARVAGGNDGGFCAEARAGTGLGAFGINDAPNWVSPHGGPGARYRFTAWVRSASHGGRAWIRVRQYMSGLQVGGDIVSPMVTLSPAWQPLAVEAVGTVAGGTFDMQVLETPVVTGEVFQVDAVAAYLAPAGATALGASAEIAGSRPEMEVVEAPRVFSAHLRPNPPRTWTTLELSTTQAGPARVHVFDTQGRVVRTVLDQAWLPAGRHPLRIEVSGPGSRLGPGMYFYRVQASEGRLTGKFTVLE